MGSCLVLVRTHQHVIGCDQALLFTENFKELMVYPLRRRFTPELNLQRLLDLKPQPQINIYIWEQWLDLTRLIKHTQIYSQKDITFVGPGPCPPYKQGRSIHQSTH